LSLVLPSFHPLGLVRENSVESCPGERLKAADLQPLSLLFLGFLWGALGRLEYPAMQIYDGGNGSGLPLDNQLARLYRPAMAGKSGASSLLEAVLFV
jgi:hypothetical protein